MRAMEGARLSVCPSLAFEEMGHPHSRYTCYTFQVFKLVGVRPTCATITGSQIPESAPC